MDTKAKELDEEEFAQIVRNAPLVSMDIVIRSPEGDVLLGLRTKEPARGYYFVPGGRIRKDEMIEAAFVRILKSETGLKDNFEKARFIGVFQHIYPSNGLGRDGYGTHYVVLAYEIFLAQKGPVKLDDQHSAYKWMSPRELNTTPQVHEHVKAYFGVKARHMEKNRTRRARMSCKRIPA